MMAWLLNAPLAAWLLFFTGWVLLSMGPMLLSFVGGIAFVPPVIWTLIGHAIDAPDPNSILAIAVLFGIVIQGGFNLITGGPS